MRRNRWVSILLVGFIALIGIATPASATSHRFDRIIQEHAVPGPGQGTQVSYYDDPISRLAYEWRVQTGATMENYVNTAAAFADITDIDPPPTLGPGDIVYDVDQMKKSNPALYNAVSPPPGVKKLLLVRRVNSSRVSKKFMGDPTHSEARIKQYLASKGIPWKNLVAMYSDLKPCKKKGCSTLLAQTNAKITFAASSTFELKSYLREVAVKLSESDFANLLSDCNLDVARKPGPESYEVTVMSARSTHGCPPQEEGKGAPGALAKALESSNLGGVDFSTLQMRYMSDSPSSGGLQYSFSGQRTGPGTKQNIDSALGTLTNSAADLRTWLVLPPSDFWVNLNPSEPDRIIDPQMGETNAGKAMLQADLQLKTTSAKLEDPRTKLGAQYWKKMAGSSHQLCYGSRMWIVPGDVQVREDGGSLYILKAQLAVKAVPDHVATGDSRCHYNAAVDARGKYLDDTMIVPRITKAVNTAPEYAAIRQAFTARVVAQWIRDRYQRGQQTSFDTLIDSGNLGRAKLQGGWKPRQVFNTYVHQLKSGLFTYKTTVRQGHYLWRETTTVGGVDFTNLHPTTVSAAQMNKQDPRLPQTVKASTRTLAAGPDGSMWLGVTIAQPTSSHASAISKPGSAVFGRTGILVLIVAALGVVTLGVRGSRRKRRRKAL